MKSAIFAAAYMAVVVSATPQFEGQSQNNDDSDNINVDICQGFQQLQLPEGLNIGSENCPSGPPPSGRTNVWHPPHHVDIDNCDSNDEDNWHYVQPCDTSSVTTTAAPYTWSTSTITQALTSTVISCAPEVTNCPGRTTVYPVVTTTFCPVPATPASTTFATVSLSTAAPPPPPPATQPAAVSTEQQPSTITEQPPATTPANVPVTVEQPPTVTAAPPAPPAVTRVPPASGNVTRPPVVIAGASSNTLNVAVAALIGVAAFFSF